MKKSYLEHVLRAAGAICEDNEVIIIGSQSLHGKYPDLADEILMSHEVDIIAKNKSTHTEFLNVIGIDSPFHIEFGYYGDHVAVTTAVLPKKWENASSRTTWSWPSWPPGATRITSSSGRFSNEGWLIPTLCGSYCGSQSQREAEQQMAALLARLVASTGR